MRFPVLDVDRWRFVADEKIDAFAAFIRREKPKMILLCAPDNPTSQVPSTAFVRAALEAATEVGGFLVIDFAYKELVWGDNLPEYFSWGPTDNFVSIHSNSKWCRGLGRRLGWVEAPVEIVEALEAVQGSSILCPDTLHQMALADYVRKGIAADTIKPYIRQTAKLYETAARRTIQAINAHLGLPCLIPQGGLYTVIRTGVESSEFTRAVLEKTGVIVVPGWGFGATLKQAVRVSYGPLVHDLDRIDIAMKRVGAFLARRNCHTRHAPASDTAVTSPRWLTDYSALLMRPEIPVLTRQARLLRPGCLFHGVPVRRRPSRRRPVLRRPHRGPLFSHHAGGSCEPGLAPA